jgi:hypothetical protein
MYAVVPYEFGHASTSEHVPHDGSLPSSFVVSFLEVLVLYSVSTVSLSHVAPGRPHVPTVRNAPRGTTIVQST